MSNSILIYYLRLFYHFCFALAPMIFGTLIDDSCILWQESCSETGACLVYDNSSLSRFDSQNSPIASYHNSHSQILIFRYMLYLALSAKLCSTIFFFGALVSYKPPKHIQQNDDDDSIENTNNIQRHEIIVYNNNRSDANDVHI